LYINALWSCPSANDVWGAGIKKLQKSKCVGKSFKEIFSDILEVGESKEIEIFVVTARRLWLRRNAVLHGEKFLDPNQLVREALESLEAFQYHNGVQKDENQGTEVAVTEPSVNRWLPPKADFVKINWDAAVETKRGRICNTPSPLRLGVSHFFFSNKIFAKIHKVYQST
jgi:hypothetical protein